MEQKYVIAGRSLATMFQWQGASIFDRDEAQRYADDLNNDPQNQDHSGAKLCFYWPKAVAPDTLDTSDLDTQPNYEPLIGDVVQFQYSTETKPKLILGTVASRFDVGKWRITTELHGTFIRSTGDLKLICRAIVALDTSDLDTQPIVTFDDGPDTIILRRDAGE